MNSLSDAESGHAFFQCGYPDCTASYRRKEHLNRHSVSHTKGRRFSCLYCASSLARSDLLRRHVQKYHPDKEPPAIRTHKACESCHARKERCDGGYPCRRCRRRKVSCFRTSHEMQDESNVDVQPIDPVLNKNLVNTPSGTHPWIGQEFVDIYFDEFHPTWPFLHRATFDYRREPCILIQSVLMIGLWIKGDPTSRERAMSFHNRVLAAIQEQKSTWYIPESSPLQQDTPWLMASYQGILLQVTFSLIIAKSETPLDINLRCQLPGPNYDILTSLVETTRSLGVFNYLNMLAQHSPSAPPTLVWVAVEEAKRLGLALYKLCRLCTSSSKGSMFERQSEDTKSDLLTLQDLEFSMPDSDDLWNAPSDAEFQKARATGLLQQGRDNLSPNEWISQMSVGMRYPSVGFDWI
ncbi:Zn(II)2Cys6 transcription factor [Aspergillus stella-maris]|uniref:Zn(II)2Cys6 transcription factor n=1 Tax=Aspergillus stella-maris TaxID=1810926 RepID=UPI003CCD91CC